MHTPHVARSGNTRAVYRKSYIHPEILRSYEAGVPLNIGGSGAAAPRTGLKAAERGLRAFLRACRPAAQQAA